MANKALVVRLARDAGQRSEGQGSDLIRKAYFLAEKEFDKQSSHGREELEQAVRIAKNLFELGFDNTTVAAAILHDIEREAGVSPEKIALAVGKEVGDIVTEYTKLWQIEAKNIGKLSVEMLSTIILATAKDLRAIFIKLAGRLDALENRSDLIGKELEKRAEGALRIYAPICQKLGLYEIQAMLEDSSLKIINPQAYNTVKGLLGKTRAERNCEAEKAVAEFSQLVGREKKGVSVQGRAKGIYSIYRKMEEQGRSFEKIYDRLGIRLICDSVRLCYELLGIVHSEYKTVPNEFNDHIANPKKNGYKSIHTAVLWKGQPLEVQIRTWEMHYEDETGLAAHWQYKRYAKDRFFDKRLGWAKQLVEWHRQAQKEGNLAHSLKMDFGQNRIFVFTPKHQVVVLPEGSSPIDFAFAIHSDLGSKCLKAKVNGKIKPLSYSLENADSVEIVTGKQAQPKRQWLSFAKTHKAKMKIKQKLGIKPPKKKPISEKNYGSLTSARNTKIAKCCNPVPGDEIVGVRTTKRKISIHRAGCGNAGKISKDKRVEIKWGLAAKDYVVGIKVKASDRPGLLPAILKIISRNKVAIASTDAKTGRNNILQSKFNIKIKNIDQLDRIISKVKQLPGVLEAERD